MAFLTTLGEDQHGQSHPHTPLQPSELNPPSVAVLVHLYALATFHAEGSADVGAMGPGAEIPIILKVHVETHLGMCEGIFADPPTNVLVIRAEAPLPTGGIHTARLDSWTGFDEEAPAAPLWTMDDVVETTIEEEVQTLTEQLHAWHATEREGTSILTGVPSLPPSTSAIPMDVPSSIFQSHGYSHALVSPLFPVPRPSSGYSSLVGAFTALHPSPSIPPSLLASTYDLGVQAQARDPFPSVDNSHVPPTLCVLPAGPLPVPYVSTSTTSAISEPELMHDEEPDVPQEQICDDDWEDASGSGEEGEGDSDVCPPDLVPTPPDTSTPPGAAPNSSSALPQEPPTSDSHSPSQEVEVETDGNDPDAPGQAHRQSFLLSASGWHPAVLLASILCASLHLLGHLPFRFCDVVLLFICHMFQELGRFDLIPGPVAHLTLRHSIVAAPQCLLSHTPLLPGMPFCASWRCPQHSESTLRQVQNVAVYV
ncbi:hypothetical protein LXA43DRAFT_1098130 [Ganoderma leucocontextum]|nr:hypothetical protein LXA43DRAFT_1098130 [Ganoderma leucocontextum]